jgi:hypothetical protein
MRVGIALSIAAATRRLSSIAQEPTSKRAQLAVIQSCQDNGIVLSGKGCGQRKSHQVQGNGTCGRMNLVAVKTNACVVEQYPRIALTNVPM